MGSEASDMASGLTDGNEGSEAGGVTGRKAGANDMAGSEAGEAADGKAGSEAGEAADGSTGVAGGVAGSDVASDDAGVAGGVAGAMPSPAIGKGLSARKARPEGNKLTLSMLVRNESGRFLEKALLRHADYIDSAVILDDASSDDTPSICCRCLKNIPFRLIHNAQPGFSNEVHLRKQQWEETLKTDPDWILCLDADEMFEDAFANDFRYLINQDQFDLFCFRLYDFWDGTRYREDRYWSAHRFYRPFLVRPRMDFKYIWEETPQHCGRLPKNVFELPNALSSLRLKHFGWSTPELRKEKYDRYMTLDPGARYGVKEQYESILDENPILIDWVERNK
jgi:hypothetical protein